MSERKPTAPRLDLSLQEMRGQPYEWHDVVVCRNSGHYQGCGGYAVRRDERGHATAAGGQWWVGICWSAAPERGPYRTLASARKAIVTDQVLTPALVARGWRS